MTFRAHRFSETEQGALHALISGYAALGMTLPKPLRFLYPVDLLGVYLEAGSELIAEMNELARVLVQRPVTRRNDPPDSEIERLEEEVRQRAVAICDGRIEDMVKRITEFGVVEAAEGVADLLREMAFEHHGVRTDLSSVESTGDPVFLIESVLPSTAYVALLDRLNERLEVLVALDPLLEIERAASAWYFARFSVLARVEDSEGLQFTRSVREWEWSLIDRATVALGRPLGEAVEAGANEGAYLPARQREMLRGLIGSRPGMYTVERMGEGFLVLKDIVDGKRYDVDEHNPVPPYDVGHIALGRLIRLDEGRWLRSPGMVMLGYDTTNPSEHLAEIAKGMQSIPPAIAMEAIITGLTVGRFDLPQRLAPADSKREARESLERVHELLADAGLISQVDPASVPDGLEGFRNGLDDDETQPDLRAIDVDEVLAEWITALAQMTSTTSTNRKKGKKRR